MKAITANVGRAVHEAIEERSLLLVDDEGEGELTVLHKSDRYHFSMSFDGRWSVDVWCSFPSGRLIVHSLNERWACLGPHL